MNLRCSGAILGALLLALPAGAQEPNAKATRDYSAQIQSLFADGEPTCNDSFMFNLVGVKPLETASGQAWFSVSKNNPSYREIVSILLLAKATGARVAVRTSGTVNAGCDTAEVQYVVIP